MTGNLHPNGYVDELYPRTVQEGQRCKILAKFYENRIMATAQYLTITNSQNDAIKFVSQEDQQNILYLNITTSNMMKYKH